MTAMAGELLSLVQQNDGGEDPRYSDAFSQLRSEVEKLSGNDFEKIRDLGLTILREQALDLRVLAYLSLSYAFLYGSQGLSAVLEACNWVLEQRWEACVPQREKTRTAALNWLANDRLPIFLARHETDNQQLSRLDDALREFYRHLSGYLGDAAPRLKQVEKWLQDQQASPTAPPPPSTRPKDAVAEPEPRPTMVNLEQAPVSRPQPASSSTGTVDSDKAEQKALRDLLAWYRQEKQFEPLVALSRVMRWAQLVIPPADNGMTRLAPPRPASLNAVSSALDRQQWDEALLAAERAFLEPGGQFCFQIQYWAHQAANRLGRQPVADCIEREMAALLGRHRDLIKLQFSDGSPFLQGDAINWVEALLEQGQERAADANEKWQSVAIKAATLSNETGLVAGLEVIDQTPTKGRRERCQQDLLKAELCLAEQRHELALPLLEAVAERLDDHGIADWEPAFALRVWRLLQQALRAADVKDNTAARLEDISNRISRTDITAAATML